MTLVHFLVDLVVAGVLTALLARVVELAERGSSDDGPSEGGGGGWWWRRPPAPPAPRPHPTGARDRRNPPDARPHDNTRPARVRVH